MLIYVAVPREYATSEIAILTIHFVAEIAEVILV